MNELKSDQTRKEVNILTIIVFLALLIYNNKMLSYVCYNFGDRYSITTLVTSSLVSSLSLLYQYKSIWINVKTQ